MRARISASTAPSRRSARSICCSCAQIPESACDSGGSCRSRSEWRLPPLTIPCGSRAKNSAASSSSRRSTGGCTIAFKRASLSGSLNTSAASRGASMRLGAPEFRGRIRAQHRHTPRLPAPARHGQSHPRESQATPDRPALPPRSSFPRQCRRSTQPSAYAAGARSADATVFDISMAMVSGPTPPGTGVYAEARSAMASGSTSPTSTLPAISRAASFSGRPRKMRLDVLAAG